MGAKWMTCTQVLAERTLTKPVFFSAEDADFCVASIQVREELHSALFEYVSPMTVMASYEVEESCKRWFDQYEQSECDKCDL